MKHIYIVLSILLLPLLFFACLDDTYPEGNMQNTKIPLIEGGKMVSSTARTARLSATLKQENGSKVTRRGFLWSKEHITPATIEGNKNISDKEADTIDKAEFIADLTNLDNDATYYGMAYAANKKGTAYGSEFAISTIQGIGMLKTSTPEKDSINAISAVCVGNITAYGEGDILELGFILATPSQKDTLIKITTKPEEVKTWIKQDSFSYRISDLLPNTKYYVTAYALNALGVFPSSRDSFETTSGLPGVELASLVKRDFYEAEIKSVIVTEGDAPIVACGFCWSKTKEPTIDNDTIVCTNNKAEFSGILKNLIPETPYFVRAYVANKFGIVYSETDLEIRPMSDKPVVTTYQVVNTKKDTLIAGGKLMTNGANKVIKAGICWSTVAAPSIANNTGSLILELKPDSTFSGVITGLKGGVNYYFRTFVNNSNDDANVVYGNEVTYTTPAIFSPATITGVDLNPGSAAVFTIGNMGYVIGGDNRYKYSGDLLSFSTGSYKWTPLRPLTDGNQPLERKWQVAASIGNIAYVFGGMDITEALSDDFHSYNADPYINSWSKISSTGGPEPICQMAGCAFGDAIYLIGGRRDTLTNEVWSYSPDSRVWEQKDTLPERQSAGIAVVIDSVLYAGLGLNDIKSGSAGSNKLWSMAANTNEWKEETAIGSSKIIRAGVAWEGCIYVVDDGGKIWKYDPSKKEWKEKALLPVSCRSFHCMYVLDNLIYVGLGNSSQTMVTYNPIWDN